MGRWHTRSATALSPPALFARAGTGELTRWTRAGSPLTPSYNHEPSTAAAAANPSAGSVGIAFAFARAHPSISLARGLFMPPRMTSAAGIVKAGAAPVMKPSNLPNAVRPKKGKTSAKKNKTAGGSGTLKA
ncbi:hypothetical protein ZWY2020_034913 [Hordeum vulgare]|nr:hypothetical protein ZWY2020_034913 [Hordeum vulgare]